MTARVDPDLMAQFAAEVGQHLAAMEQVLIAADGEAPRRSDIDLLFRGFHSIKGLARVIEARGMEALAHEAESLLAPLRAGGRGFDEGVQEPLIATTDALKEALADPIAAPAPAALMEMLRHAAAAVAQEGASEVPALAGNEPWRFLGDDPDLLRAFAELLCELLPEIAQTLRDGALRDGVPERLAEPAGILFHAAGRLGFAGLGTDVERLAGQSDRERIIAFAALLQRATRFGSLIGEDCGVAAAVTLLHDRLAATALDAVDAAFELSHRTPARECALIADVLAPGSAAGRLIADLVDPPPASVAPARDGDALMTAALNALRRELEGGNAAASVLALAEELRAPYRASDEIEAHLRKIGLDTSLLSPGPPRRQARLAALIDGSGTTLKEVAVEIAGREELANLAALDPLLGQSVERDGRRAIAVLLLGAEETEAVGEQVRATVGGLIGEARRLDPGHASGEFAPAAAAAARTETSGEAQVRVPVEVLDKLFGRIGEFFSIGSRLNVLAVESDVPDALRRLSDHAVTRAPELRADIERLVRQHRDFCTVEVDVGRVISLIHESTLGLRVIPLDTLVARFPRLVRDTARSLGKRVRFLAETGGIRIDKGMSDMLADPLTHMLRNAIDHGIEPEAERLARGKPAAATLRLIAQQQTNRIVVEMSDDGRGIDLARVKRRAIASRLASEDEIERMSDEQVARFIFTPGFSTAAQISDISGRGVGLDVALVNVTRLGGKIDIATTAGEGVTFRLDMPLSAAIQPMLLADTGIQPIGFPEAMVSEALVFPATGLQHVNGQRSILLRERFLPIFKLTELLRLPEPPPESRPDLPIVLCEWSGQRMGVEVHRILRRGEMLIRETHPRVAALPGIGGISTMGFDRIVLVLDPDELFDLARKASVFGLRVPAGRLAAEQLGAEQVAADQERA
jgi:two-component system, chemotaxis family, sensor kinase CheA